MQYDTVLLFPGQGSQHSGMGLSMLAYREYRETLQQASDVLGRNVEDLCVRASDVELEPTRSAQVAILVNSVGILRVLSGTFDPDRTIYCGHSLGEYSALVAAGGLRFDDALRLVDRRARHMSEACSPESGMAGYLGDQVQSIVNWCNHESHAFGGLEIANLNSPEQIVLSGSRAAIEQLTQWVCSRNLGRMIPLAVAGAFHSSWMKSAALALSEALTTTMLRRHVGAVLSSVNASIYTSVYPHDVLARQLLSPVRWSECMREVQRWLAPNASWIEVGAGTTLTKLAKQAGSPQVQSTRSATFVQRILDRTASNKQVNAATSSVYQNSYHIVSP